MNMRSNTGRNLRAESTSTDGGATWTPPADSATLIEPVCQASLIRHEPGLLVFSNPAAKTRIQLTVRASADNAKTWRDVALLHAGPSAYSSLVSLDADTVGCFYENWEKRPYERITFARVALAPAK
ncbi:MAG: sialidase family protein [Verrucomicrobia bacterium]|nr:sialidase family protein [Verrucomicrobiota bacterium]